MLILEAKTEDHFNAIIELERNRPEPACDCSFETYENYLRSLFKRPEYRAWLVYDGNESIGYIGGIRTKIPRNQILVDEIVVKKEHWGRECLGLLIKEIINWMKEDKILRIVTTTIASHRAWQRIADRYELNVTVKELLAITVEVN